MRETSEMLPPAISADLSSTTFSQALEAGLTHSDWLDGRTIDPSSREAALASHSARLESGKE